MQLVECNNVIVLFGSLFFVLGPHMKIMSLITHPHVVLNP